MLKNLAVTLGRRYTSSKSANQRIFLLSLWQIAKELKKMFFDDFKSHCDAKVRESLLWEYDPDRFDWQAMRTLVVQRVVERGRMNDFYAILNLYGLESVKEAIRQIPYLNPKDLSFVCSVFELRKEELKCYTKQQSAVQHWNS